MAVGIWGPGDWLCVGQVHLGRWLCIFFIVLLVGEFWSSSRVRPSVNGLRFVPTDGWPGMGSGWTWVDGPGEFGYGVLRVGGCASWVLVLGLGATLVSPAGPPNWQMGEQVTGRASCGVELLDGDGGEVCCGVLRWERVLALVRTRGAQDYGDLWPVFSVSPVSCPTLQIHSSRGGAKNRCIIGVGCCTACLPRHEPGQ